MWFLPNRPRTKGSTHLTAGSRGKRRRPAAPPRRTGLSLERMEDRSLLSAGALDPTFGSGGIAQPSTTVHGFVGGIAVYPNAGATTDGDVVAAGAAAVSNSYGVFGDPVMKSLTVQ